jgi:hypothetical protein
MTSSAPRLVIEISSNAGADDAQTRVVDSFPVTIGRGYDCDIIIGDPYLSARHARVDYDGDVIRLSDMGSENGTPSGAVQSGAVLRIGRTDIRILKPSHPVPPAVIAGRQSWLQPLLNKPAYGWLVFFIAVGLMAGWTWLEVWNDEVALVLSVTAAVTMAVVLIWATIWSAAGRLMRQRGAFTGHVAIASLFIIISAVCFYLQSYINYLANENILAQVMNYLFNIALITPAVYLTLGLATDLQAGKRWRAAALFSVGMLAGSLAFGFAAEKSFEPEPRYATTLEPYLTALAHKETVTGFMAENERIFSHKRFSAPAEAK